MARKKRKTKVEKTPLFEDLSPHARQAIWAVVMGIAAVFFLFSLLDYAGPVGRFTEIALQAMFGGGAWLAPLVCVIYIFVLLNPREDDHQVSGAKITGTILLFVSLLGALELYSEGQGGFTGLAISWPLVAMLGNALTGVLIFGLVLISIFLLLNTGLKLHFFRRNKEAVLDEEDFIDPETLELPEEDQEEEPEESDEETNSSSTLAAVTQKMAALTKGKANEITVKNFNGTYVAPSLSLLSKEKGKAQIGDVKANANTIKRTLREFGISVEMDAVESGPTITRYSLKPAQGVKISRIVGLQQELQLALKASTIRIEAPIPGKSLVGIEVPNQVRAAVGLASLLSTPEYTDSPHPLMAALGKDVTGNVHFANIARMPHGLIAGTTGAGKSVAIHNLIISLLYRNSPDQLRFILVDPKRVELTLYNKIPHLLTPVITNAKKTIQALSWAVKEMERRYDILEAEGKQNIHAYHEDVYKPAKKDWEEAGSIDEERINLPEALPYIVIILDELNDIMQAFPRELEACIVRLAQMSRAVGIHLILATQRPSVNVITGTIKANIPTRIALMVASQIDSRTILDTPGAEKLLGRGDMLYLSSDSPKPVRLQSAYVSEEEIKKVVNYLKDQAADELETINFDDQSTSSNDSVFNAMVSGGDDADDELYEDAKHAVMEAGKASTSYIQRKLRVGYSRAARLMDLLEENGVIGPADGSKAREILSHGTPPESDNPESEEESDDHYEEDNDTEERRF
ncbi:DNA translocase FtsK [Candidatus Nomurabacteria bacterium]|nr:DNA translocase FtsK [Candidatus Kaiserbacteria bacterium]MCB9815164.1 DNA translocase FtsK [Candidatus Nomurabacteria bacterium]